MIEPFSQIQPKTNRNFSHMRKRWITDSARYMILCAYPLRSLPECTSQQQTLSSNQARARWRSTSHSSSPTSVPLDEGDITRTRACVQRMIQNRLSGVSKRFAKHYLRKPTDSNGTDGYVIPKAYRLHAPFSETMSKSTSNANPFMQAL